jgi:putative transposase
VTPATLLAWHRKLTANARHEQTAKARPAADSPEHRRLAVRLAKENPLRGYRPIHGGLTKLGVTVATSKGWEILRAAGIDPAPRRSGPAWQQSWAPRLSGSSPLAFLHAGTVLLKRPSVLVFSSADPGIRFLAVAPAVLQLTATVVCSYSSRSRGTCLERWSTRRP